MKKIVVAICLATCLGCSFFTAQHTADVTKVVADLTVCALQHEQECEPQVNMACAAAIAAECGTTTFTADAQTIFDLLSSVQGARAKRNADAGR